MHISHCKASRCIVRSPPGREYCTRGLVASTPGSICSALHVTRPWNMRPRSAPQPTRLKLSCRHTRRPPSGKKTSSMRPDPDIPPPGLDHGLQTSAKHSETSSRSHPRQSEPSDAPVEVGHGVGPLKTPSARRSKSYCKARAGTGRRQVISSHCWLPSWGKNVSMRSSPPLLRGLR